MEHICGRFAAKYSLTLPDFDWRYCACINTILEIDSVTVRSCKALPHKVKRLSFELLGDFAEILDIAFQA